MKVFNFPILQTQCGRGHWLGGHPGQTGQSIFQLQLQVWKLFEINPLKEF